MRKTIIGLIILFQVCISYGHVSGDSLPDRPKNNINIKWGQASLISLNFERLFFIKENAFISASIGAGYTEDFQICIFGCNEDPKSYLILPHQITLNIGSTKSFFEIGLGGSAVFEDPENSYLLYPILGYKYQPLKPYKVIFRVQFSYPVFNYEPSFLFIPFAIGIGIGF